MFLPDGLFAVTAPLLGWIPNLLPESAYNAADAIKSLSQGQKGIVRGVYEAAYPVRDWIRIIAFNLFAGTCKSRRL
jgi:hypothetical protein